MKEAMELMKQVEKTTPNDWEKQSENIIDDLLNLIITRHAKNFTADELLRFLNYTLQFRPKYLIGAGQLRLRAVLKYLETNTEQSTNLTLLITTML